MIIILILQEAYGILREMKQKKMLAINNASSFKYNTNLIGDTVADGANRKKENVKIAVP